MCMYLRGSIDLYTLYSPRSMNGWRRHQASKLARWCTLIAEVNVSDTSRMLQGNEPLNKQYCKRWGLQVFMETEESQITEWPCIKCKDWFFSVARNRLKRLSYLFILFYLFIYCLLNNARYFDYIWRVESFLLCGHPASILSTILTILRRKCTCTITVHSNPL